MLNQNNCRESNHEASHRLQSRMPRLRRASRARHGRAGPGAIVAGAGHAERHGRRQPRHLRDRHEPQGGAQRRIHHQPRGRLRSCLRPGRQRDACSCRRHLAHHADAAHALHVFQQHDRPDAHARPADHVGRQHLRRRRQRGDEEPVHDRRGGLRVRLPAQPRLRAGGERRGALHPAPAQPVGHCVVDRLRRQRHAGLRRHLIEQHFGSLARGRPARRLGRLGALVPQRTGPVLQGER